MTFMEASILTLCQAARIELTVLGIISGLVMIVVLYAASVLFYFFIKNKYAYYKAKIEIVFIGLTIFFSFIIKLITFIFLKDFGNIGDGMNYFWEALYASIGGLTFEGLGDMNSNVDIILQCFYYGSSIYAGLMTLTLLTLGLSHELYSFLQLLRWERKKDIYVFTALTEETLQLAKSIKQHDIELAEKIKKAKGIKKGRFRKSVIVFSGYDLDAFDKHDDLCRQVVMEGFLYWSFYKRNGKKKKSRSKKANQNSNENGEKKFKFVKGDSLSKILHLNNKNIRRGKYKKLQEHRFCVLAFDSKKHIPEEENNIGFVFDDIKKRIDNIEKDKLRIEYYILTKRDINYQAYIQKEKEIIIEFANTLAEKSRIEKECTCCLSKINRVELANLRKAREELLNSASELFIKLFEANYQKVKSNAEEIKKLVWKYYCDKYLKDWNSILGEIKIIDEDVTRLGLDKLSANALKDIFAKLSKSLNDIKNGNKEVFKYLEICEESVKGSSEWQEKLKKAQLLGIKDDIDYQLQKLEKEHSNEIALERLKLKRIKYFKKLKAEYCKHFVITAINEALIISKDVISDLELPFEKANYQSGSTRGEQLTAYLLGFGSTGQAVARALHMRAAYISKNGYAAETHFEVFDGKANEISGLFAKEHPMWICGNDTPSQTKLDVTAKLKEEKVDIIKNLRVGKAVKLEIDSVESKSELDIEATKITLLKKIYGNELEEQYLELLRKEIIMPTVRFHQKSCFDMSILDILDNVTGPKHDKENMPSVIAIALGSDYDNIRMANALIADIIREEKDNGKAVLQTIVVNIWDSNNNMLVDTCGGVWSNDHKTLQLDEFNLTVKIVGNNTDIYSYDKMLDHDKDAEYNAGYDLLYKYICGEEAKDELVKEIVQLENCFIEQGDYNDGYGLIRYISEKTKMYVSNAAEGYENIDMWKRESSACIKGAGKLFYNLTQNKINEIVKSYSEKEKAIVEAYKYLSKVEHQRWLRFYIANGWQYFGGKLEMRKYHNCIIPFSKLKNKNSLYNVINVIKMLKENGIEFQDMINIINKIIKEAKEEEQNNSNVNVNENNTNEEDINNNTDGDNSNEEIVKEAASADATDEENEYVDDPTNDNINNEKPFN